MTSLKLQNAGAGEAHNQTVARKLVTVPLPDGGWGWVVVFASFMIQAIVGGVSSSFGLFFTRITNSDEIEATKSDASWIGSIMLGVTFGAGLMASAFVNRYECRAVTIAGSFVAAFGFAISYWAFSVYYLYVSIGIIGGFGLGLMYLPAIVFVSYYFEKKRAFATGISVCGAGFGTFTLAPILDFLISWLGWRASFLGVAAILLLCVLFAILFRPLPNASVAVSVLVPATEAATNFTHDARSDDTSLNLKNSNISIEFFNSKFSSKDQILSLESENKRDANSKNLETVENNEMAVNENKTNWFKLLDLSLLKNPIFVFFVVSNFLSNVGIIAPYIYYADMARDNLKLEEGDPALGWLVSSIGIATTLCRFTTGYLSDTKYVNRLYLYSGSLVICGIATAISAYGNSLTYLVTFASIVGGTGGIYVGITSVILVDLLGLDKLSDSFGIVLFSRGLGSLIGPPFVGLLFDIYKHYVYGFWFAGISVTLSGSMLFLIPIIKSCMDRNQQRNRYEVQVVEIQGRDWDCGSTINATININVCTRRASV